MQNGLFHTLRKTSVTRPALIFAGMMVLISSLYAINTISEGWRINSNTTTVIDTTSIGGDCRSVVTPADGKDRFVPTKTVAEWNAFKAAAPGQGITLNSCISNSLLFDSASSQYLSRTPSIAGNRQVFTFSYWIKRGKLSTSQYPFGGYISSNTYDFISSEATNDHLRFYSTNAGSVVYDIETAQVFRDPSSWYHIVVAYNSTQATASNRVKIYVNGSQVTTFTTASYPALNANTTVFNTINSQLIGQWGGSSGYFDGYFSDTYFVDGQALDSTAFGYTDPTTNQWLPKAYTGTYGTNGFHLTFANGASLGADTSGNGNNWTVNGGMTAANNQVIDTPVNNFATLNPLDKSTSLSPTKGNLTWNWTSASHQGIRGTMELTGKVYIEGKVITATTSNNAFGFGFATQSASLNSTSLNNPGMWGVYSSAASNLSINGTIVGAGSIFQAGDLVKLAFDRDNNRAWVGKNGVWFDSTMGITGDPSTGANPTFTSLPSNLFPYIESYANTVDINFGQKAFTNTIPTGFKALSTANLPDPTIKNPKQYFDVAIRNGTSLNYAKTGLAFKPDFFWTKSRNVSDNHYLQDVVRGFGASKSLSSNTTDYQGYNGGAPALQSFAPTSDGYTLNSTDSDFNSSSKTYVDWLWRAGGTAVSNTAGSVASQVSASPTSGFSIVKWTYNGEVNPVTIGHGLGQVPAMIITKHINSTIGWYTYHKNLSSPIYTVQLNTTNGQEINSDFGNTAPTSSVLYSNTTGVIGRELLAYVFAEVPGFSKFGSYTGNGSADGPFVYTGFRPRYVMIKRINNTGSWTVFDTARDTYNGTSRALFLENSTIEDLTFPIDILSNGFKLRHTASTLNISGDTIIYAAFAEAPFKYANAR